MTRICRTVALGLIAFVALTSSVCQLPVARSDEPAAAARTSPLDGAWQLVESKNGNAQDYQKLPDGTVMTIYITGGRFVWTIVTDNKIGAAAGGRYTVEKGKYTEQIEYTHGAGVPESFVGSAFEFTAKVEGNIWYKVGTVQVNGAEYKIDEKWERCK